jgi:hypothetical protein
MMAGLAFDGSYGCRLGYFRFEDSDGSRVPHLNRSGSGLPPRVAITNAARRIGGFARLAYTVGVPDRSPAQERGLTADDYSFGWRTAKSARGAGQWTRSQ